MIHPELQTQTSELEAGGIVIHTAGLEKRFDDTVAVQNVSFDVPKGKIFGFIGPSGSGKTTTIRMLTGYYLPTAGKVSVLGKRPADFEQSMRARIGYMPQLFVLYPNLSVWENLNFAASIYGVGLARGKLLKSVLEFVELDKHRHKLAREISAGMQRRLSLAATLVHNPELIFLDEPTAGVDPVLRQKFWDHFRMLRDSGRTLFVTTQYVSEANYCDLVGVMDEGTLLTVDTPGGLRHQAYGGDMVDLQTEERLDFERQKSLQELPFVRGKIQRTGERRLRLVVDQANTDIPKIMEWAADNHLTVSSVEEFTPPFDEVLVELLQKEHNHGA